MAQRNDDNKSTYKWEKLTTSDYYYLADNTTDARTGSERPHPISDYDYEKDKYKFWEKVVLCHDATTKCDWESAYGTRVE